MEMYPNGSSIGASLTLQPSNSFRDVSFSSYLDQAEEHMIRKLTNQALDLTNNHHYRNKPEEDEDEEELGVFGAEKYFKGEIEDVENKDDERLNNPYKQNETVQQFDHRLVIKLTTDQTNTHTPSVRSNVSYNSRTGLLPRAKLPTGRVERGSKTKTFLSSFGCNCINKKSTQISERRLIKAREILKPQTEMFHFHQQPVPLSSKLTEGTNGYFSFPVLDTKRYLSLNYSNSGLPVLNSNDPSLNYSNSDRSNSNTTNLAGKVEVDNNGQQLSLGKKLNLLNNWDSDIETDIQTEMYIPSSGMYNRDVDSDSSSDLFEIESISTTGNNSFVTPRKSNGYAPSEVSVDWSVVTASAADFSVVSDYEEVRTGGGGGGWKFSGGSDRVMGNKDDQKKRPGILSGCTSYRAVRVAGDGYKIGGGRAGPAGGRQRLSDSVAVGNLFRGGII